MEDKRLMDIYQAGVRLKKEILNQSEKDNIYKCINAGSRAFICGLFSEDDA